MPSLIFFELCLALRITSFFCGVFANTFSLSHTLSVTHHIVTMHSICFAALSIPPININKTPVSVAPKRNFFSHTFEPLKEGKKSKTFVRCFMRNMLNLNSNEIACTFGFIYGNCYLLNGYIAVRVNRRHNLSNAAKKRTHILP